MLTEYNTSEAPSASQFWKRKFDIHLDKSAWSRAKDVTRETRLLVLHWKILQNIYPTNIMLNKMEVKDNNKCSYCKDTVDFIEHFFFDCPMVLNFWKHIEDNIYHRIGYKFPLTNKDILFGVPKSGFSDNHYKYINNLILIGKMSVSIYKKTESALPLHYIFEREFGLRKHVICV